MEKKKKPAIRFKGFTDSWEQRKLGDVASSFEYGLNAAAKAYDGEYKYIRITDIDDNTHEFLTDNLTSPDIDLIGADNYKLTEGDILFARTGASVGKSYIYRNSDGLVYYAGFLIRARINEEYDEEFVFQNTLTDRYNKYIAVTSQRSGQPGVNAQEYAEFEINVPKKEEQTKIGTYFRNLDYLITLHQREFKYVYCRFIINKYKYISENYICIYTKIYGGLKMNNKLELYHGSGQIVEFPEIRKTRYTKDFSWGFYCTKSYEQAYRWAERKHENGIVNVYSYIENSELNIKKFDGMCEEWLDFIAECRAGKTHPYDIVEGPMADDTIWNFVNDYLNKNISKEVFWEYARFKHPSHQISFHSIRALECLKYERSIAVENDTVE